MGIIEGSQSPSFNYQALLDVVSVPATLLSQPIWSVTEVAALTRNRGLTTDQIFTLYGITANEVLACVMACDAGYR